MPPPSSKFKHTQFNCKRRAEHYWLRPLFFTLQILYPIIVVTFGFVFVQAFRGKVKWLVALPFAINLVANLIFTPIQFGMRNLLLAAVDILVVWTTIVWLAVAIWPHCRWVSLTQIPYFVWVLLATVLQLSITWNNRRRKQGLT